MKKLLLISTIFFVVNLSFAQTPVPVDVNVLRDIINTLQKLIQGGGQNQIGPSTTATPSEIRAPEIKIIPEHGYVPTKIIQPQEIKLPPRVTPAPLPKDIETKPITPEIIKPILPDEDRSDDVIVQINNLRITRILLDPGIENVKAIFFAVRDLNWKCFLFESEEGLRPPRPPLPCILDIRRPIMQKELAIQITDETILLKFNRQKAKLEDFQVGDKINVYGFMDKDNYSIDALIVRKITGVPKPIFRQIEPKLPTTPTSVNKEKPKQCFIGGCSGEICSDRPGVITTCEMRPEYACYKKYGKCELQSNNQCGWTMTEELKKCLENPSVIFQTQPTQTQSLIEAKVEADDYGFYPSSLEFTKGAKVKLYLYVKSNNVYYGGLDFRSEKFKTEPIKPGQKTEIEFIADKDFIIESYWPLSNVKKAELKIIVK
jgi:hypothetical protein